MNQGCSSEKTSTSSSTTETNKIPTHIVNLKESKTHLFYVIQSDNESHGDTQQLVQLRISKQSPPSRKSFSQTMQLRYNDGVDENRDKLKKTQMPSHLASIHKRTDHPSFLVLPEVFSEVRFNISQTIEKNQSTSENSNATYVIRSKNDNRTCNSKAKMPTLFNSLRKSNPKTPYLRGTNNLVANKKTDFCECDKATTEKSRDSLNLDDKIETVRTAQNAKCFLRKDDLFNIDYVDPTQNHIPQRLRAGQDYDKRYKSCYMCPNMTRIFPPTSSRRRTRYKSNSGSDSTPNNYGYTKINFKLVRQCLMSGSANEKTEILDAIRMRIKSSNSNVAISTIEDIVKFDLFGVQCKCRSKSLLGDLFWPLTPSHQLQTSIAQFLNALASYKVGRNYFNNWPVIGMLTWGDIGRDNIDQVMGDNLMGIMMKMSLSRFQRADMIKNGLLSWLMQHMEEEEYSASKYHLQCMAGLLRNLLRGFNLENFSSSEIQKMIVLLGRFLDHENEIAKRFVCDSLMILFQNINCITSAKNLNFQRVIQEHATNATDAAQKEHLGVIYRLLNASATTTPHSNKKFDYRSEEEPFLDADLGPVGEVDNYSGEFLIREKFTGDGDMQRQNETADKSNSITSDDSHKHDQLITRVFIEHLNCFLPNIENNRIFPLCNSRCADKIRTCSHVGDIQPRKRQPYIPPNSRLSRQKHSMEDSTSSVGYNKSALKSKLADKGLRNTEERMASRVSTISHDKTAAKWNHIRREGSDDKLSGWISADGGAMEKIFEGRSKRPRGGLEGEEIISNLSHRHYSFETVGVSDERTRNYGNTIDDQRQDGESSHTANMAKEDRDKTSRTETKDREGSQHNAVAVTTDPLEALEATTLPIHTKEAEERKDLLHKKTSETKAEAFVESHGCTQKNSIGREETDEFAQQKFDFDETSVVDQEGRRQLSHNRLFDVSDDFCRDSEQKAVFEETTLKELSATRGNERDDSSTKSGEEFTRLRRDNEKSYRAQVTENIDENEVDKNFPIQSEEIIVETGQQSLLDVTSERVLKKTSKDKAKINGNEAGVRHEVRSEEGYHRTEDTENCDKTEVGHQLSIRCEEMIVKEKTFEKSFLDVRSERVLKKISKDNVKIDGSTGVKLKVRSEENVRDLKIRGNKLQESKVTNEKPGLTLQAKSELFATRNENQKLKSLRLDHENLVKDTDAQDIRATETGIKLNVRSDNVVLKQRGKDEGLHKLPSASVKDRKATQKLHARSMEMVTDSQDQLLRKSKSDVMYNVDKHHTEVGLLPRTPPGSQPTTTAKRQNVFGRAQNARSVEYEGTNYQLFKSSSEELLRSIENQDYSLEQTGNSNWSSRTRLLDQFAVRSKEIVGRTQSAIFNGKNDSRGTYQSSKHCVDCTGSGYVLRARPSQPCDRCKVSLTRYPDFVDALANQDYHRRDVTRTNDEWIKTDLINKTDGKLNSKPHQGNLNKEKLADTKIDEKLNKAKWNADRDVGKSSATQEQSLTKNLDKKANQNSVWVEDGDTTSKTDWLAKNTSREKEMESNTAQKTAENVTTDSSKNNEDESVTNALFLSDEIRKLGSVRSIHRQSDDCTEIASNTKPQPDLEGWQSGNVINKDVLGEQSQANLISDPAASMMSESSKQMDGKDELTGNNQHAVDDDSKSGSRDIEIGMGFHNKELENLDETLTSQETHLLTSNDTKNGGRPVEDDFDRQDSVQLNIAQPSLRTADRLKAVSDYKNDIPRSETFDEDVVSKKTEQRESIIPTSVNFLKKSTGVTNLMATTNERAAVGRDDPNSSTIFSHSIGETISSQFLSSNRVGKKETTVADDRQLNLSSSLVNTSIDKKLRESVSDPQFSKRQIELPVTMHLFPRSNETIGVTRTKAVDVNVKGTSASGGSKNASRDLNGGKSDMQTSSFKGNIELTDNGTAKSDLKNQLSPSNNIKLNDSPNDCSDNVSVPRSEEEMSVDLQFSSAMNKRQRNESSLKVPLLAIRSVEAVKDEYFDSPDNPLSEVMNEIKLKEEPIAPVDEVTPAEIRQIVGNDIASAPCSDDLVPIWNQKQDATKVELQNENICGERLESVSEQGIGKESIQISVTKSVDNKSSVVVDEATAEERNLHSDKQTANVDTADDTEIDQEEGDGNIERSRHKVKVVNSTCCRRLLNNDELINRLSEKVLEKLTNKIHRCGTNCKSPCGGLNSLFNAKNDNNLNWQ